MVFLGFFLRGALSCLELRRCTCVSSALGGVGADDDACDDSEDSDDLEVDVLPSDLSKYLPSN
jgi:hypothetical protein